MKRPPRVLSVLTTVALAAATLTITTIGGAQGAAAGDPSVAVDRLHGDADGALMIERSSDGEVTFVGTAPGQRVDNPGVKPSTSVSAAAAAHLGRYGAALGATRPGVTLGEHRVLATEVGHTVRYQQSIGGLPVLGGDVVVSLDSEGELTSILSTMSDADPVDAATVSRSEAAASARAIIGQGRQVTVTSGGHWLLDPAVIHQSTRSGPRGVWRFTVSGGVDLDREVFVDDRTGVPLLSFDNHQEINRIVCDLNSAQVTPGAEPTCTSPVRSEGGAAVGVADVDDVFAFVGATSDLYDSIGVDLTAMIGKDVGGTPKIASTVRLCYPGNCPYANAFWNGTEMYYGTGLTVDDVTGHELTHGVTDRTSELLYWGQSGAINESISDIMGEIVDHRTSTAGDSPTDWQLAEESSLGAIRNLADPTIKGDPDRTQSSLYWDDLGDGFFYNDNGGVHTNSGVSNKTAYLIMEGGTFNGQTVTGIDGGDTFPKTARLYQLVNESMASGADFADLGLVLVQSCNSLVGSHGFTAADCTEVAEAVAATQLATTPANAAQPADANTACPINTSRITLFNSESGSPASKFTSTAANWGYGEDPYWGSNAHSGQDSWHNASPIVNAATAAGAESLVLADPVTVPASGTTYMSFHGWYFLEFSIFQPSGAVAQRKDGATVEIDNVGDADPPVDVAGLPWGNGPSTTISSGFGNPAQGRSAFTADSRGWVGSRVELTSYAGQSIKPQFSVNYNTSFNYVGWFLDDITIYHCSDTPNAAPSVNAGQNKTITVGSTFSATGTVSDEAVSEASATVNYGDGPTQPLALTNGAFTLSHPYASTGTKTVTVQVTDADGNVGTDTVSVTVNPLKVVAGTAVAKGKLLVGKKLKAKTPGWTPTGVTFTYQWLRNGKVIKKATGKKYQLTQKDKGKKMSVRVTGAKPGYQSTTVTSPQTGKVKAP